MSTICPLCKHSGTVSLDVYEVEDLGRRWNQSFGFNPFVGYVSETISKKQCANCDLTYFDPPFHGDESLYARLSRFPWYYEKDKWEFDIATRLVMEKRPKSFLEVGCGNGSFLEKVVSVVDAVEGVDINESAISACVRKGIQATSKPINDLGRTYEMVALFEVLEHMENLQETVQGIVNLVAPGGYLILAVPNPEGYLKELDVNLLDMPPHHNSLWSKKSFDYLASSYGLEVLDYHTEPLRYVHYLSYIGNLMTIHRGMITHRVKRKIISAMQSVCMNVLAPFAYIQQRHDIVGQTHLVVLRKGR